MGVLVRQLVDRYSLFMRIILPGVRIDVGEIVLHLLLASKKQTVVYCGHEVGNPAGGSGGHGFLPLSPITAVPLQPRTFLRGLSDIGKARGHDEQAISFSSREKPVILVKLRSVSG